MKHYLLTLAAATLMAGAAQAQVAPLGATRTLQAQIAPSLMLNKGGVSLNAFKEKLNGKFQLQTRATRVDEVSRDPQELSYQVNGDEGNSVDIAAAANFTDLADYGCSGYGFASAFHTDMLSRYGQNKITKINFAAWAGRLTNGLVFIMDASAGTLLWAANLSTIEQFGYGDENVPINEIDCDYTLTGNEGTLLIGWMADAAQDPTDRYRQYVIMPYYLDNTGAGEGAYLLGKTASGNFGILGSVSEVPADNTGENYETAAAWITVNTEGEDGLKSNDALNGGVPQVRASLHGGDSQSSYMYLTNMGLNSISSLEYTYELDGKTQTEVYTPETELPFYASVRMPFTPLLSDKAGRSVGKLTITKVNTVDDEFTANDDNVANVSSVTLDDSYNRTPVIEEFTSNTCGWCPRGLVYMPKVAEATADMEGAVLIAVHADYQDTDPLTAASYAPLVNAYASAFPSAMVNREGILTDLTQLPEVASELTYEPVEASMKIKSERSGSGLLNSTITVTTDLTFALDAEAGQYSVAYVVTEDGVTGVRQLNYYASNYNYYKAQGYPDATIQQGLGWTAEEMAIAKQGRADTSGNYWYQPTFDHAAVYINDVTGSSAASQLPAIKAGETLTHTATFNLPTRTSPAVNPENLQIAALLIDQASGVIVTARQAKLGEESKVSAIDPAQTVVGAPAISVADGAFSVQAANATAQVFDAAGKLVSSATVNGQASLPTFGKGVYVIRVVSGGNVFTQKAAF